MQVSLAVHVRVDLSENTFFMCISVAGQITLIFTSGLSSDDASHPKSHVYYITSRVIITTMFAGRGNIRHTISFVSICLTFSTKSSEKDGNAVFSIRTMASVVDDEVRDSGYFPNRVTLREIGSNNMSNSYAKQNKIQHDGAPSLRTRSSWNLDRSKLMLLQLYHVERR